MGNAVMIVANDKFSDVAKQYCPDAHQLGKVHDQLNRVDTAVSVNG